MKEKPNLKDLLLLKMRIKTKTIRELEIDAFKWCSKVLAPYGRITNGIILYDNNFKHAQYTFSFLDHSVYLVFIPNECGVMFISFLASNTNPIQKGSCYFEVDDFNKLKKFVENYLDQHKLSFDSEFEKQKGGKK